MELTADIIKRMLPLRAKKGEDGFSKTKLAEAMRLREGAISEILKGDRPIRPDESKRGLAYLKLDRIYVIGYVGAGQAAHFYDWPKDELTTIPRPDGTTIDTVAVEIKGKSLGPFVNGWFALYDRVERPLTSDMVGTKKPVIVGLDDGRVMLKYVRKNPDKKHLFDLHSDEPSIKEVSIEWAAKLINLIPPE